MLVSSVCKQNAAIPCTHQDYDNLKFGNDVCATASVLSLYYPPIGSAYPLYGYI